MAKDPRFLHADIEDSDQTGRFLSCRGFHNVNGKLENRKDSVNGNDNLMGGNDNLMGKAAHV